MGSGPVSYQDKICRFEMLGCMVLLPVTNDYKADKYLLNSNLIPVLSEEV